MRTIEELSEEELTRLLAYAGLILVAFELIRSLIVNPIKFFYLDTTFSESSPFTSYEEDVLSRHKSEFEASLLYLRDFMEAVDSDDVLAIQELRKHRNDLAHNLANMLQDLEIDRCVPLLERANRALFKLSNYRLYIEIGADPEFQNVGIDWDTATGREYSLLEEVLKKVRILKRANE